MKLAQEFAILVRERGHYSADLLRGPTWACNDVRDSRVVVACGSSTPPDLEARSRARRPPECRAEPGFATAKFVIAFLGCAGRGLLRLSGPSGGSGWAVATPFVEHYAFLGRCSTAETEPSRGWTQWNREVARTFGGKESTD